MKPQFFGQPNSRDRKHFLEVRKRRGIHLTTGLAKLRLLQVHHHLVVPRRERVVSQSHPWCLLRWAFERVVLLHSAPSFSKLWLLWKCPAAKVHREKGGRKKERRL